MSKLRHSDSFDTEAKKGSVVVVVDAIEEQFTCDLTSATTGKEIFDQLLSQDVGKKRPICLNLRAKFFPEDIPRELIDPATRRLFFLQVQRSVVLEDLYCPSDTSVLLASYSAQVRYGDYSPDVHGSGFLDGQRMLPQRVLDQYDLSLGDWENRIVSFYKDHKGLSREQAILEYLCVAQDLDMFGISYYDIKNRKGTALRLGVGPLGLYIYEKDNSLTPKLGFPWNEVKSIAFNYKKLLIKTKDETSADFSMYLPRVRHNKQILMLCMGNHELFSRRRQVLSSGETSPPPPAETDTNRAVPSTSFQPAPRDENPSDPPMVEAPSSVPPPDPVQTVADVGLPLVQSEAVTGQESGLAPSGADQLNGEGSLALDTELSDKFPDPPNSQDLVTESESSMMLTDDGTNSTDSADMTSELSVTSDPSVMTSEREETRPASLCEPSSGYVEFGDEPGCLEAGTPDPEPARATDRAVLAEQGESGKSALEQHNKGDSDRQCDVTASRDGLPDHDGELHWQMSQEAVRQSRAALERELHVLGSKEYEKLQRLFEELARQEKGLSPADTEYLRLKDQGLDKYKTLRNIQQGHTKTRISIFEAM